MRNLGRTAGRLSVALALYRDSFLSRHALGGGRHRHSFGCDRRFLLVPDRLPGAKSTGDDRIHIIVTNGRVLLLGLVDTESAKTVADIRAREVPGSFGGG